VFTTDAEALAKLRKRFIDSKIRDFGLIKDGYILDDLQPNVLHAVLPSLLYYADVNSKYLSELFTGSRQSEKSDQFDFEQLLYLDRMDYFITNDTSLHGLAKSCGNEDLDGRLLTVHEFNDACDKKVFDLCNRAPRKIDRMLSFEG